MKDTFTTENARDFNARYVGSYGLYVDEARGTKIPVYLKTTEGATLYFENLDGVEFHTRANSGITFEFMQMTRKLYPALDGHIYYVCRRPARQWTRGVSDNNTQAYRLCNHGPSPVSINHKLIKSLLSPDAKTADGNILLSDQFAIVDNIVYLYNNVIGEYYKSKSRIELLSNYSEFKVELEDALRTTMKEVTVHAG